MSRQPFYAVVFTVFCLGVTACSDEVEPRTISVAVQASPLNASVEYDEEGPWVVCDLLLSASAAGTDQMLATWETGMIEILGGPMRNITVGYIELTDAEVQEIWTKPGITVGEDVQARLLLAHPEPFSGKGVFRYLPDGSTGRDTARFNFSCDAEGFSQGEVWLRFPQILTTDETIEAGEPLLVRYHAGGGSGIIQTEVQVASGSGTVVTTIDERARNDPRPVPSSFRTVQVPITGQYAAGSQLRVKVVTTGPSGAQASSEWMDGPIVVDRTIPKFLSHCLGGGIPDDCVSPGTEFTYTPADTLRIRIGAWDNHQLRFFVWRIGDAPADSVELRDGIGATYNLRIPVQSSWSAVSSLTFHLRDGVGNTSIPVQHRLRMIPRVERPTRSRSLPGIVDAVVADSAGETLYLAFRDGSVSALALQTMAEKWRATLPGRPMDIDLSPDESTLALPLFNMNAIALVDVTGIEPATRTVALESGSYYPQAVSYLADGSILAATPFASTLTRISPDGTVLSRPTLPTQKTPWHAFRAADYSRIYLQAGDCNLVFDAGSDRTSECRTMRGLRQASTSSGGERIVNGPWIFDRELKEIAAITIPGLRHEPFRNTGLSGDGETVFWAHPKGVLGIGIAAGRLDYLIPQPTVYEGVMLPVGGGRRLVSVGPELVATPQARVVVVDLE